MTSCGLRKCYAEVLQRGTAGIPVLFSKRIKTAPHRGRSARARRRRMVEILLARSGGTSGGPRRLSYGWRFGADGYLVHLSLCVNVMLCAVCACASVREQSHGNRCHFSTRARARMQNLDARLQDTRYRIACEFRVVRRAV